MSIYTLARHVLPHALQAKLGNRHKVKRRTIDPLFFHFTHHPHEEQLAYQYAPTGGVSYEALEDNPFIDPAAIACYRRWYDLKQIQQTVRVRGDVWIEPATGWPMGRFNALYLSLFPSGISPYMPVPSYRSILGKSPVVKRARVISLRNAYEQGYSHFYTDLMAQLVLVERCGVDLASYTLVVSRRVAESHYGKFLLAHCPIFKRMGEILVQEDAFVACEEAIFSSVMLHPTHDTMFTEVIHQVKAACDVPKGPDRNIFLTRGRHRKRTLRNGEEINAIAAAHGFEVVDTDTLSLPEQITLFTHCRNLIGIHGAGLINMLYRVPNTLSLLEIREPVRPILGLNPIYHNLAVAYGFRYGTTLGEDIDHKDGSFFLQPEQFTKALREFFSK